ncbi:MAG: hypothetical protein OEY59_01025 [Deltaproteobacteria bacterium]|nr:hypothetical protein [Deltaproteobacteria bacterium]
MRKKITRVKNGGGFRWINQENFNPETHQPVLEEPKDKVVDPGETPVPKKRGRPKSDFKSKR